MFLKNERNVTNFGYVFVQKFHIPRKIFSKIPYPIDFFFKNDILKNVKKVEQIYMDFEKSINSF